MDETGRYLPKPQSRVGDTYAWEPNLIDLNAIVPISFPLALILNEMKI
jgi:hypothetical protein